MIYTDNNHKYTHNNDNYISITTLLGKYKSFNKEYALLSSSLKNILGENIFKNAKRKYAPNGNLKNLDYSDINILYSIKNDFNILEQEITSKKEELLKEWDIKKDDSNVKGTAYHLYKEGIALDSGYSVNEYNGKKYTTKLAYDKIKDSTHGYIVIPKVDNLYDLEDGFYPELLIWNHNYKIAGQADKIYIETIDGVKYVDIDDFKTNKKIDKNNIFSKMKNPLSHLDDCNYNHYRLQISMYGWMLESFGFTVRNTRFTHINKPYIFNYMKKEIELILFDINNNFL